jgi:hypothetical protein
MGDVNLRVYLDRAEHNTAIRSGGIAMLKLINRA